MKLRTILAIWAAKAARLACKLKGTHGETFPGRVALKIDPAIIRHLIGGIHKHTFVVCGTNGKTTTNNLLCAALEREGMLSCFEGLLTPEVIPAGKDKPDIYLAAARLLGSEPQDTWVFEDSLSCVLTARDAGFPVIAVEDSSAAKDRPALRRAACRYIASFRELLL